ncbi:hypothetical protein HG535_0H03020 [Zygotorulaspora mrakii]|uniref:25S rRNA adenine-N(1) methyltransferase n=1 Tax=Zygotorulaspora mrakii TaxID=42260 RepID=A0A7H9B8G3_ZYGMR|nr:uncharacterized protein HG535_0H03020 [Zygotorulaspora mrakii]QLG74975.1 hypothetical protein HG535_0H03020 [Zygotorulaspora mrakii]
MLSKKRKSITGNKVAKFGSTTIKPSKARRIIRKFHVLINKRKIICDELGITLDSNDEKKNLAAIASQITALDKTQFKKGLDNTGFLKSSQSDLPSRDLMLQNLGYITSQITTEGGLATYQMASRNGQSTDRGGDSSKKLVQWLRELRTAKNSGPALEIGSLSCENAISKSGIFNPVIRIDLNNANDTRGITKQDFMLRPLPKEETDTFALVSCSLVLNFVPTPSERGEMIKRLPQFIKPNGYCFLVLPLPCMENSRYIDKEHFTKMMQSQGFEPVRCHDSQKLCYFLFRLRHKDASACANANKKQDAALPFDSFSKVKLHDGPNRNNFCIVIEPTDTSTY